MMNIRRFYPMGLALAAHTGHCSLEQKTSTDVFKSSLPFLADITEIGDKINKLFATKKDLYATALHIKHMIEQVSHLSAENQHDLLSMAFIELKQQFPDQEEELEVVKHNIFKLR